MNYHTSISEPHATRRPDRDLTERDYLRSEISGTRCQNAGQGAKSTWISVRTTKETRPSSHHTETIQILEIAELSASDAKSPVAIQIRQNRQPISAHVSDRNQAALALLRSWRSEDADDHEQRETLEILKKTLDQDRTSRRKLFP